MDKPDYKHLGFGLVLAYLGGLSVACSFPLWSSLFFIFILCLYEGALLIECAHRGRRAAILADLYEAELMVKIRERDTAKHENEKLADAKEGFRRAKNELERTKKAMLGNLPHRSIAIIIVFLLAVSNISYFANIYIQSEGIQYMDSQDKKNCSNNTLRDKWDAVYFSSVTLTTLGDGDFSPKPYARFYVVTQLFTGLLLLLCTFPIVAGRLSAW